MQRTDFSPSYARKTKYPPPPARQRNPVTVKDCRREIGFSLLLSGAFIVFALLCCHGHDYLALANLILAYQALAQVWSARQTMRQVQRGEIVSGELAWSLRRFELMVARFVVTGITITVILWVMVAVAVFQDYRSWTLLLAEMCLLCLMVNWRWKRHLNS